MKVTGSGPLRSPATRRVSTGGSGGSGFRVDTGSEEVTTSATSAARPTANVSALLSLQEMPDATERRRRGIDRGKALLARLEAIRMGLLAGRLPRAQLERLLVQLRERSGGFGDPHLDEIVAEIEVRAAVEIAKLEQVSASTL